MSDELKNCPFCGGEAVFSGSLATPPLNMVRCTKCPVGTVAMPGREAGASWNLRAPSSNEALLREALEKCADDLEAELKARWCFEPDGSCHPALQHKFDRDMVVVNDARKLLAKIDAVLNTVDEPGTREPE